MKQLAFSLFLLSFFFSCKKNINTKDFSTSKDLPKYFLSIPSKTIGQEEKIVFDFNNENFIPYAPDKSIQDLVSFEPFTSFDATWLSPTTLTLKPSTALDGNKEYKVNIQLGKLFTNCPKVNENISFKFQTKVLTVNVALPQTNYSNVVGDESITVIGKIENRTALDSSVIKKAFQFSQKNNDALRVEWTMHYNHSLEYAIKNIKRYDKDTSLVIIKWDGTKHLEKFIGKYNMTIPKREDFSITSINASDDVNQKIEIAFSNIIKYNQVLDGLFTVKKYPVKFKTQIESNVITLFPEEGLPQDLVLQINKNILDKTSRSLLKGVEEKIHFNAPKPEIKDIRAGVIIPETDKMLIPFEGKNLHYVDISVRKIFQNNVIHFLRHYDLKSNYRVRHVGRTVYKEKIDLHKYSNENNTNKFVKYSIDLKKMADKDPGCIYKINISFKPSYVKKKDCELTDNSSSDANEEDEDDGQVVYADEEDYEDYYDYGENNISDPCQSSYYGGTNFIEKTVMLSNVAVIAKAFEKNLFIICNDILSAQAMSSAEVTLYDQQKQVIAAKLSDESGIANFSSVPRSAKFIIVKKNKSYSYLDLGNQNSNDMTDFAVEGAKSSKTIDGFIYTDRGIYRPGDSIFLNTIIVDKKQTLPKGHPLHIVVTDAQGHVKYDKNITQKKGNIFSTIIPTLHNDPTGNWNVSVVAGNASFEHTLKVETIKPNRLKIAYENHDKIIDISKKSNSLMQFKSKWLHGASGQNLKAEVDVKIVASTTSFEKYSNYNFDDPMRSLQGSFNRVFDGTLNADGKANYKILVGENDLAPGFVQLNIKTRVYEKSGNFSEDYLSTKASPYASYVGVKIPKDNWDNYYVKTNTSLSLPFICLDKDGNKLPNRKLSFGLYTMHPSWWYEENEDNSLRYNSGEHIGSIEKRALTTDKDGQASWNGSIKNSGYYMVRICDDESGHCSGQRFYVNYYQEMQNSATNKVLSFTADKKSYNNGETIKLKIPSNENSNIIVSLENSKGVLKSIRVNGKKGFTNIDIPASADMHPNVYIHASLMQKYVDKNNDLPIRMYGVIPINVIDPATILQPQIIMPNTLEPDREYSIGVKEKNNKPFTYTLAVVDEGYLDVTRFKTPDPHKHFFAKQALNVRTWDIYDEIASTFNGKIYKTISIGGDGAIDNGALVKRAERFKPVAKFYGPFTSNGGLQNHKIKISNYVGSVRAMVVACNEKSFGNAEVTVPVKKPLMIQSSLPRVLYIGDEFTFASNVFAMQKDITKIEINVEATPNCAFLSSNKAIVNIGNALSDDMIEFKMKAVKIGKCKIKVTAKSGKYIAVENIEIDIINPNPLEFAEINKTIYKNEILEFETFGVDGSNKAVLQLSNVLSLDCERRLKYLIHYPYGCLEQTTSSVFPQLYVGKIMSLPLKQEKEIPINIKAGIERLASFQTFSGGFSYWPGASEINTYANSYAGHFLIEARSNGYSVPNLMMKKWLDYQTKISNNYVSGNNYDSNYDQAYRLYTLALAGEPNKGAMNVLKLSPNLDEKSRNMLACTYALTDVKSVALELFKQSSKAIAININTYTFNSSIVDLSIKSKTIEMLNLSNESVLINQKLVSFLSSPKEFDTHSIALALMAIANHNVAVSGSEIVVSYTINGQSFKHTSKKGITLCDLPLDNKMKNVVHITNYSSKPLFAKITYSGSRPIKADTKVFTDNLLMKVNYFDQDHKPLDIRNLPQGKDFYAEVVFKKTNDLLSYYNLAYDFYAATGWEIQNDRVTGQANETRGNYDYQDIRDNLVYTFFNLKDDKSKVIKIKLTASYKGKYFLPAALCSAMYNNSIKASSTGYFVNVTDASKKEVMASK